MKSAIYCILIYDFMRFNAPKTLFLQLLTDLFQQIAHHPKVKGNLCIHLLAIYQPFEYLPVQNLQTIKMMLNKSIHMRLTSAWNIAYYFGSAVHFVTAYSLRRSAAVLFSFIQHAFVRMNSKNLLISSISSSIIMNAQHIDMGYAIE